MNESQVFGNALKFAAAERVAYLDAACAGDPPLRAAVEALLQVHAADPDFLEQPVGSLGRTVDSPPAAGAAGEPPAEPGGPARPGVVLAGRYKLLEQIGEGGMGTVWMAQQQEPVKRLVAVKLIKAGMDSRQVVARFEAERQALALMDHPNIARVLDAGATGAGRPYFVMDLVKGVPITKYCDEHHLTPRQRLELFVPVCQAVQHAHQKGIIHRDLKPSNVLVALYDGKPVPKVIDFGVAKAAGQQLTDKTLVTGFGAIIGTLEYMSPEQAEINQLDIDTRSDIYSLGVLLYELLTGSTPFTRKDLEKAGMLEMLRVIREQEPSKPSAKLSTAEGLPTLAANRGTEPAKLTRLVRGELDWIVVKALEKDRGRRYETANGFAMDVQRYLADEPVQACPPSAAYRFLKFARRNKGPVLAASLVLLVLVAGIIGTTLGMFRATKAEGDAVSEAGQKTVALGEKETALATARANELEAHKQETLAKENAKTAKEQALLARRRFHDAQANLAQQALEAGQPARALELLESLRPKFDQEDLRGFEWYYLWRLCHRNLHRTLSGPTEDAVYGLAITPDGKTLVSGSKRASVRVWDVATGRERAVLTGHNSVIWCVAISPDGKMLASASGDQTVKIWDLGTSELLATLTGRTDMVRSVAFAPDGKVLAAGTEDGALELWDVGTWKRRLTPQAHGAPTVALAYSPDGKMLATGAGWDTSRGPGGVKVRDVTAEPPRLTYQGEVADYAVFSPDSKLLATGGSAVKVWSMPSGELKATLVDSSGPFESVAFSADGNTLALGCRDRTVKLWEFSTGATRTVGVHRGAVNAVAFVPQSDLLASGSNDGTVKIWHTGPPQDAASFVQKSAIRSLAFTPDSKLLFVGSDQPTTVLDAATGKETAALPVGGVLATSADANLLAARAPGDKRVIWDVAAARARAELPVGPGLGGAAFARDGKTLMTWIGDDVRLWDLATSRVRLAPKAKEGETYCAAFSPDGTTFATGHQFGSVTLWDAANGQLRMTVQQSEGPTRAAFAVAFSNDGTMLAAGNSEGMLRLWDVETGQLKGSFKGHTHAIRSVAFCPDDRTLLSGSDDRTARLWDVVTGQELLTLKGYRSPVTLVAFAPDGKRLATASGEEVKLWLAATEPEATAFRGELDPDDPDGPRAASTWGDRLQETRRPQEAENAYRQALARLEKLAAALPDAPDYREELAYSLIAVRLTTDAPPAAAEPDRPFAEIWDTLPADRRFLLRWRLLGLADDLRAAGRFPEALRVCEQATALMPGESPVWQQLAKTHEQSGQPEKAIAAYSRAIDLDPKHAVSWNNRGVDYHRLGQFDNAIADFRQAVALAPNDPVPHVNLANALRANKDFDGEIAAYRQALQDLGPDHPGTPKIQSQLAEAYLSRENLPEAVSLLEQLRDHRLAKLGPNHRDTLESMNRLAVAYWRNKQLDRSIPLLEEAVRLRRANFPDDPETYTSIANLGMNYQDAGRPREAIPLLEEVVEWVRKRLAPGATRFTWVMATLGQTYEQDQQFAKGEPLLRDCLAIREKAEPDAWTTFNTKSLLGGCLLGQQKYAEAEPLLLQGYEGMKEREAMIPPLGKRRLPEAVARLVRYYDAWDDPDQAAKWRNELAAYKQGAEEPAKPKEK